MWAPDPDAEDRRLRTERFLLSCDGIMAEGAVALAVELGILDAQERATWQVRGDRERPGPVQDASGPVPGPARERLEALASELEALGPAGSDSDAWWAIQSEAGVLRQIGVLSAAEADAWGERAAHAVGLASRAEHRADVVAQAQQQAELLEVHVGEPGEGPLQVVEVRRYRGMVEVISLLPWAADDDAGPPVLTDDVGTIYECRDGRRSSDGEREDGFRPEPPNEAARLRLAVGGHHAEVRLR